MNPRAALHDRRRLSVVGWLSRLPRFDEGTWHLASFITFGVSLVLLYTASSVYHAVKASEKSWRFAQEDYVMIFVPIAGSYTPFCSAAARSVGWSLLGTIWGWRW